MITQTYFANVPDCKKGIKLYRTALAALVERHPEEAENWLLRDGQRAVERASELLEAAEDAAKQLDLFTGEPVGLDTPKAVEFRKEAKAMHDAANMSYQAAALVGAGKDQLDGLLDHAMLQHKKLIEVAAKEKAARDERKKAKERVDATATVRPWLPPVAPHPAPSPALVGSTPMLRQYADAKAAYPGALMAIRVGDFYEFYGKDAEIAAEALEITLTGREDGENGRVPMSGIPHHAVERYLARLIAKGHRVALCEQLEDPKTTKGLVKRGVVAMFDADENTPGGMRIENLKEAA